MPYDNAPLSEAGSKPLSARTGNWMCMDSAAEQREHYARASPSAASISDDPGTCTVQGCWHSYATTWSDYVGAGSFGYGDTVLGDADTYFDLNLNGSQSISKPVRFMPSVGVSSVIMEGERLYYSSAQPTGKPVSPSTYSFYQTGAIGPYQAALWSPNGYKGYENTVSTGGVVHQWTWTMAEFPGSWWVFAKSVRFHKRGNIYENGASSDIPNPPGEAGYHTG